VFVERIWNVEMRGGFGIVQLSGKPGEKPGEKRKHGKASIGKLEACGSGRICYPFVGPGVMM